MATSQNLPYTLSITPVSTAATPLLPGIQSADYAQSPPTAAYPDGLWLIFGGRTNGLHNFTPSGVTNFPADFQNEDIIVINPANWQTWSLPWSQTDVPVAVYNSLSSAAQEFYQKGNTLYTVGGYSVPDTINFTGNTTDGSTTVGVSDVAGLAVGQFVIGPGNPTLSAELADPGGRDDHRRGHQYDHDQPGRHGHGHRCRPDRRHEQLHNL